MIRSKVVAGSGSSVLSKHLKEATIDDIGVAVDQRSEWAARVVMFRTRYLDIRMLADSQTLASWNFFRVYVVLGRST